MQPTVITINDKLSVYAYFRKSTLPKLSIDDHLPIMLNALENATGTVFPQNKILIVGVPNTLEKISEVKSALIIARWIFMKNAIFYLWLWRFAHIPVNRSSSTEKIEVIPSNCWILPGIYPRCGLSRWKIQSQAVTVGSKMHFRNIWRWELCRMWVQS